jgi:hypothetical protein
MNADAMPALKQDSAGFLQLIPPNGAIYLSQQELT